MTFVGSFMDMKRYEFSAFHCLLGQWDKFF